MCRFALSAELGASRGTKQPDWVDAENQGRVPREAMHVSGCGGLVPMASPVKGRSSLPRSSRCAVGERCLGMRSIPVRRPDGATGGADLRVARQASLA